MLEARSRSHQAPMGYGAGREILSSTGVDAVAVAFRTLRSSGGEGASGRGKESRHRHSMVLSGRVGASDNWLSATYDIESCNGPRSGEE